MQVKVLEHRFDVSPLPQQAVIGHFCLGELFGSAAIEQDHRIGRRGRVQRRAVPFDTLQTPDLLAFAIQDQAVLVLDEDRPRAAREHNEIARSTAEEFRAFRVVFRLAWQSATKLHRFELVAAHWTDL